jgi:L-proline---[L-prolyl-carrier protein] ligase
MNKNNLLHYLARAWAERSPASAAIEMNNRSCTYLELEQTSNRVAHALIEAGLKPGERVGIYAPKSIEVVAVMLGTLKAGGVYVPIDAAGSASRAQLIMRDCALKRLVTTAPLLESIADDSGWPAWLNQVILIGTWPGEKIRTLTTWAEVEALPGDQVPEPERGENDPAYILYTSGSTGTPKGVTISHRNALAFVEWAAREFRVTPSDRLSNHAPFHFDLSVFDLYVAFLSGARALLVDEAMARHPRELAQWISEKAITIWYSVPSALILMLEQGGLERETFENLRVVLFAGEVLQVKHLRRMMRVVPVAEYYNLYGPTETNVCTYHQVKPADVAGLERIPIGRECSGDTVSVRDEFGNEIRGQEIGELCVEGPTVMLGYWSEGRIAERLKPYRTGDLVSRDSEGRLIYHGRKDGMVKVKGFRVHITEVETALAAHPGITEAIAVPLKDKHEGTYLLAAVIRRSEELSVLEVKQHCAKRLPAYMIPQVVKFFPDLPRTSTGKVDRITLTSAVTSHND